MTCPKLVILLLISSLSVFIPACTEAALSSEEKLIIRKYGLQDGQSNGCTWSLSKLKKISDARANFLLSDHEFNDQALMSFQEGRLAVIVKADRPITTLAGYRDATIHPTRFGVSGWLGEGQVRCENGEVFSKALLLESFGNRLP